MSTYLYCTLFNNSYFSFKFSTEFFYYDVARTSILNKKRQYIEIDPISIIILVAYVMKRKVGVSTGLNGIL